MTRDELFDAINDIDDKYIEAAASYNVARVSRLRVRYIAIAASVLVIAGAIALYVKVGLAPQVSDESAVVSDISDVDLDKRVGFGSLLHKDNNMTVQVRVPHNGEVIMSDSLKNEMETGREDRIYDVVIKLFSDDREIVEEEIFKAVVSELPDGCSDARIIQDGDNFCIVLSADKEQLDEISAGQDLGFFIDNHDSVFADADNQNSAEEK